MTAQGWLQIAIYLAVLTALTPLLGGYMARVYRGERVFLPCSARSSALLYRAAARRPDARAGLEGLRADDARLQRALLRRALPDPAHPGHPPVQPQGFHSAPWDVTFNTASSFVTNTNWQYYGGETTMTYFSQMAGLAVQNFVSAAVGMAVLVARDPRLREPRRRRSSATSGRT